MNNDLRKKIQSRMTTDTAYTYVEVYAATVDLCGIDAAKDTLEYDDRDFRFMVHLSRSDYGTHGHSYEQAWLDGMSDAAFAMWRRDVIDLANKEIGRRKAEIIAAAK